MTLWLVKDKTIFIINLINRKYAVFILLFSVPRKADEVCQTIPISVKKLRIKTVFYVINLVLLEYAGIIDNLNFMIEIGCTQIL